MKILILSDADSPHTIKWVTQLTAAGLDIILFSITPRTVSDYDNILNLKIYDYNIKGELDKAAHGKFSKLKYLKGFRLLEKINKNEKPDIIHAHYASSYGLLGSLLFRNNFLISTWGSDVYYFPRRSVLHSFLFRIILSRAKKIFSSSKIMAEELALYINRSKVRTVPFGIDAAKFDRKSSKSTSEILNIGIIKSLEKVYNIDHLILAYRDFRKIRPEIKSRLLIFGDGTEEGNLKNLCEGLDCREEIIFKGRFAYSDIVKAHQLLDIEVYPSESESFGVAPLEAMASGNPVIAYDIMGLAEIIENGRTGILIKKGDIKGITDAIIRLFYDKKLWCEITENAAKDVSLKYDIKENTKLMIKHYEDILND